MLASMPACAFARARTPQPFPATQLTVAGQELLPPDECFAFPAITVDHLFSDKVVDVQSAARGRVSLVGVSYNAYGKAQVSVATEAFAEAFGLLNAAGEGPSALAAEEHSDADVQAPVPPPPPSASALTAAPQIFDVQYLGGAVYSMLSWALKPGVRKTVPAGMEPHSFIKFQVSSPALSPAARVHVLCPPRSPTCLTRRNSPLTHASTTE